MTMTFSPGVNPSYSYSVDRAWPHHEYEFQKPWISRVPLTLRPVRTIRATYVGLTKTQLDYFLSFFRETIGPVEHFYWPAQDVVTAPAHRGPDLSQVTSGALSERTYYVKYSWYDPTGGDETTPSPTESLTVAANKVLLITVPVFPSGVPAFRVYASEVEGTEWSQGHSTERTWQEPDTGLVTATTLSLSVNSLQPDLTVTLASDVKVVKTSANRYSVELVLREEFAT